MSSLDFNTDLLATVEVVIPCMTHKERSLIQNAVIHVRETAINSVEGIDSSEYLMVSFF